MDLKILFNEFGRDENLKQWNMTQFNIWIELARKGLIDVDDPIKFMKFGEIFYNLWIRNKKEIPDIEEIKLALGV